MKRFLLIILTNHITNCMQHAIALPYTPKFHAQEWLTETSSIANKIFSTNEAAQNASAKIPGLMHRWRKLSATTLRRLSQQGWHIVNTCIAKDTSSDEQRTVRTIGQPVRDNQGNILKQPNGFAMMDFSKEGESRVEPPMDQSFQSKIITSADRWFMLRDYGFMAFLPITFDGSNLVKPFFADFKNAYHSISDNPDLVAISQTKVFYTLTSDESVILIGERPPAENDQCMKLSSISLDNSATAIASSLDGNRAAATDVCGNLIIINANNIDQLTSEATQICECPLTDVAISCDGNKVVALTSDGKLILVELDNLGKVKNQACWNPKEDGKIKSFSLSPDGNHLAASIENDGAYTIVAASTNTRTICSSSEMPTSMDISNNGTVVIGYKDKIEIYDTKQKWERSNTDICNKDDAQLAKVILTEENGIPRCAAYYNSGKEGITVVLRPGIRNGGRDLKLEEMHSLTEQELR